MSELWYCFILQVISYSFREPAAFRIKQNVATMFVHQGLGHVRAPYNYIYNFQNVSQAEIEETNT